MQGRKGMGIDINKIMDMLDWNNDEEIQAEDWQETWGNLIARSLAGQWQGANFEV